MSVEKAIICDSCGNLLAASHTAEKARVDVRAAGGRTNLPGGADLCGTCVREGRPPDPTLGWAVRAARNRRSP